MKKLALLLAAVLSLTAATACGAKDASSTEIIGGADGSTSIIVPSASEEIPAPALDQKPVTLKQFEAPTGPVATMKTSMGDLEIMLFPEEAPMAVENFITHAKAGYYDGLIFHRVIEDFMIQGGDPLGNGTGGESIWKQPFTDEFSDSLHNFRGALSMANSGANTNGSQFFIVQSDNLDAIGGDAAIIPQALYNNLMNYQVSLGQARINEKAPTLKTKEEQDAYIAKEQAVIDKLLAEFTQEAYAKKLEPIVAKYKEVGGTPHLDNKHTVFGQVIKGMEVVDAIADVDKGENDKPKTDVKIISVTIKE